VFAVCSYHAPAPERKRLLIFHGRPQGAAHAAGAVAIAYPALSIEISDAERPRLT